VCVLTLWPGVGLAGDGLSDGVQDEALSEPAEIREAVGAVLRSKAGGVTSCYELRLHDAPELAGTWTLSFSVLPSGRTTDVSIERHGPWDHALEDCIIARASSWTFPPMATTQRFEKPYTFGQEGPPAASDEDRARAEATVDFQITSTPALRACFEDERERLGDHRDVTTRLTIEPDGSISAVSLTDPERQGGPFEACLSDAMMQIQVPPFEGEPFTIDYPFRFAGSP